MTLTRPLGRIFPVADATISMVPHQAQISAMQYSRMMALPIGDGGVSTISSAAGRNASSSRRFGCGRRSGMTRCTDLSGIASSADLMEPSLQTMQRCIAAAGFNKCVVVAIFNQAAAIERDDAVRRPHGREPVRDHEHRPPLGDSLHVLLNDALALIVQRARCFVEDQDARVGDERARNSDPLALAAR